MFENLLDDPTLLAGLCAGTDEAYTYLFDATIGELRQYFRRWKFKDADPEDLAQITLLKLYQYDFSRYESRSLAALVTTFARNVRVDQFRKCERRPEVELDLCDQCTLGTESLLDQAVSSEDSQLKQSYARVTRAMATLPEKHREILERSVLRAEPMVEIAKELGLSLRGAYARLERALNALRKAIET